MAETTEHCKSILREFDRERYLSCLYLAEPLRQAATTLYAFDTEISRIPQLVSEPGPGEIRIQFWRDFLKGADKEARFAGPLGSALIEACETHDFSKQALDQYLDARIFDLYHDPMSDTAMLEGYCGETASVFFQMLCLASGEERSSDLADLCGHAGMAYGLDRIISSLQYTHATKRVYIPLDVLNAAGLNAEEYLATSESGAHGEAVSYMAVMAREYLAKTRLHLNNKFSHLRQVFRPLAVIGPRLKKLEKEPLRAFDGGAGLSPLATYWHLWRGFK